jgi:uncharacterized protein YciI
MPRFLIITTRTPAFSQEGLKGHNEHLRVLREAGKLGWYGPFSDATGGAYMIDAASLAEAEQIAHADPLIQRGDSTCTVKEWQIRE